MKLKYFLHGFGMGILFATIVLSISFYLKTSERTVMTDMEIIEQAKKLGMIEKEDISEQNPETETTQKIPKSSAATLPTEEVSEENSSEETSEEETLDSMTQVESISETMTTIKEETEGETITETTTAETSITTESAAETSSMTAETTIEVPTVVLDTTPETTGAQIVTITVKSGMSSEAIARLLQENGVITNSSEFNHYMVSNNYANRMRTGIYEIPLGADYETLAEIFCK